MSKVFLLLAAIVLAVVIYLRVDFSPVAEPEPEPAAQVAVEKVVSRDKRSLLFLRAAEDETSSLGREFEAGARLALAEINSSRLFSKTLYQLEPLEVGGSGWQQQFAEALESRASLAVVAALEDERLAAEVIAILNKQDIGSRKPLLLYGLDRLFTCRIDDAESVASRVWQLGITSEMMSEPFFIHLADSYARKLKPFKIVYFYSETESEERRARELEALAASLSFENSKTYSRDPRVSEYYSVIEQVLRHNADLFMVVLPPRLMKMFLPQSEKMSVLRDLQIATVLGFRDWNQNYLGELSEGLAVSRGYFPGIDSKENEQLLERVTKSAADTVEKSGDSKGENQDPAVDSAEPETRIGEATVAGGYTAVKILAAARYLAKDESPRALSEAMERVDLRLPQGQVYAEESNHTFIQPLYAGLVQSGTLAEAKFIGSVAHPGFEGCALPGVAAALAKAPGR